MTSELTVEHYIQRQLAIRPHEFIPWHEIIQRIPKDKSLNGAFLGSYSLTLANRARTYVGTHHNWCKRPASASSVARLMLRDGLELLGRKRIYWNKKSRPLLDISHPLYCEPLEFGGRMIYVDIASAYYTIYSRMPMDIRFQGLRAFNGDLWFRDFLPRDLSEHKLLRNSLVGCLRQLTQSRVKNGQTDVTQNRNVYLSPEHWGFIAHLLHTIAASAIRNNARYFHTDGAIFTRDEDAIKWATQLEEWGFIPNIKAQGSGYIRSVGNYKIGEKPVGCHNPKPLPFNNLIEPSPYVLKRWIEWQ